MSEGFMGLANNFMHIWAEDQLLQNKLAPLVFFSCLAQKYEGTVQFARSGTINIDALITANSADH